MAKKPKVKDSKTRAKTVPIVPESGVPDTPARPPRKWNGISNLPKPGETPKVLRKQHPREAIQDAFAKLGGRRWLVRLGKQYPKEFASLLARMLPQDVNVTGTVGYAPLAIPVEQREPIPGVCVDITPPAEPDPFM